MPVLPSLPFLQDLYDIVVQHSEKRMPRWKLQLQPDALLELQPKLTRRGRLFVFRAVRCAGVTPALLQQRQRLWPKPWLTVNGKLVDLADNKMGLHFGASLWSAPTGPLWDPDRIAIEAEDRNAIQETVTAVFADRRLAEAEAAHLFHPYCLICGKHLKDPVSKARMIGPECAGTASPHLRSVLRLAAEAA
jgi:hypothetical protein